MKKVLLTTLLIASLISCSKDDDPAAASQCLVCSTFGETDITTSELSGFCVGATNPDTGEVISLASGTVYKDLLNLMGATCTIE